MGRRPVFKKRYTDLELKNAYAIKLLVYFQKNGIRHFSMSRLAKDFNISKTTLYNHFSSKDNMVGEALNYKLSTIVDYKTVLFNKDLIYTERYRKAMLFYCVQVFQISNVLLFQIRDDYPHHWRKVVVFQGQLLEDLREYYELGQRIGYYQKDYNPILLSWNDQQFFEMLSKKARSGKNEMNVVDVFNHHCRLKFNGLLVDG